MNTTGLTKALTKGFRKVGTAIRKYAPQILMGASVAGVVTTTVLAVKATVKATKEVEDVKYDQGVDELPAKEVIAITWKHYIPTAISLTASVACGILSCTTSMRRNAALATLYSVSEMAREEYVEATKETVGKAKAEEIETKAVQKNTAHEKSDSTDPEITEYGTYLMKDYVTGRYFRSTKSAVEAAAAKFELYIRDFNYASFNDWFDFLGLEPSGLGNNCGYNAMGKPFEVYCTPGGMHPVTGESYTVVNYKNFPYWQFDIPSANM